MPRQRLLTPAERQAFDASPVLNAAQRTQFFAVSPALSELIASLRTPTNQVGFLLQLGYFRAAHRFFSRPYHPHDAAYIAHRLEVPPDAVNLASYDEATARRHRRLILEHLGYRPFDELAQQRVTAHLRPLIRSLVRPKVLFQEAVAFLPAHKVEIPSSGTLTQRLSHKWFYTAVR